jgi:sRNA-binding protein
MFVRKDKDGNLVGVGSIDRVRLAQLQGAKRKAAKAAESKVEPEVEPEAEPEVAKAVEPESADQKAVPNQPKTKSSATPTPKTP